jgi:hypothetical protein
MNYLKKLVYDLKLDGVYYTPKKIVNKITINYIIGNPPYKTNKNGN